MYNTEKEQGCDNCKHSDNDKDEFPCSECHIVYLDKWEPGDEGEGFGEEGEEYFW